MITAISVPTAVAHKPQIKVGEVSFVDYHERGGLFKNQVVFQQYAISFVMNGQKEIYRSAERTIITAGQAMLIPAGNTVIAEHSLNDNLYNSVIIFFPGQMAVDLLSRLHINLQRCCDDEASFIRFNTNHYLNDYARNLQHLIQRQELLSPAVAAHKLEEVLLIIYELYPRQLVTLLSQYINFRQVSLKNIVESNLLNKLTLEEMAFLANRSRSSFKRDFEKAYGISPQKYIRSRKLEMACAELQKGRQPSELYYIYGYDNLSNFATAFKKQYGLSPSAYRQHITG